MNTIQDEDDLTLLDLYRIRFTWYGLLVVALELLIAWYFFHLSKTLFWFYIIFFVLWIILPSYDSVRHKVIEQELKRRNII